MGWIYMQSLGGHFGPRQYLDAQFTYVTPEITSKVLRSALVSMRVYYAAVEHVHHATEKREVWAAVCLVRYNPRDREGYIFGYKDMAESMGPCEADCPEPILDLLTPSDRGYANEWRPLSRECRGETGHIEQAVAASGPDHRLRRAAGALRRTPPRPVRGHRQSAQPSHHAFPRAGMRPDLPHHQREETKLSADRPASALTANTRKSSNSPPLSCRALRLWTGQRKRLAGTV
jgi:hypothetical protein